MDEERLHYEDFGDNYKTKDPYKLWAASYARTTAHNLNRFTRYGLEAIEITRSRGDSSYQIRFKSNGPVDFILAHVEEGLGTKNVASDELEEIYGETFYKFSGKDNVATALNDLSTSGCAPLSYMLHVAAYPPEWFEDERKARALFEGTAQACNEAQISWGGGESATERDIIYEGRSLLSGSAVGLVIPSDKALSEDKLVAGDLIVLLASSGIHTNAITLLRRPEFLTRLPYGYQTTLSDGMPYGLALLTPSIVYSRLVEELVQQTEVHYAAHITGHGWRKFMRPERPFTYRIKDVPEPHPIFALIKKYTAQDDKGMYDTYNMGTGYALYMPNYSVDTALKLAEEMNVPARVAGVVEKGPKRVILEPLGIEFKGESLRIR